jgi:hypothetical protein
MPIEITDAALRISKMSSNDRMIFDASAVETAGCFFSQS